MKTMRKTCNLCEATCGLLVDVDDERRHVLAIRPDHGDIFSRGHICPKAFKLKDVQEDPERLRFPMRRTRAGDFERVSWEEALAFAADGLVRIQRRDGRHAVATYLGNPSVHNFGAVLGAQFLLRALHSHNRFSASSLDQNPKHASSLFLYGNIAALPVPDLDRTHHLLMLGANPLVSNGSLMTAPGVRERLRGIQKRGGKVVVVDPRRTETAKLADEHHFIRPGADAFLLAALLNVILEERLGRDGPVTPKVVGLEAARRRVAPFTPEAVAGPTGIAAEAIRKIARDLARAPSAACYGRIGTCLQEFGTLASWLVDVVDIVTGNLDRPGGAMFTTPAVDIAALARTFGLEGHVGAWKSRVRGVPEFNGELPTACLAEEILTPGAGQVRGLLTIAGNPVLSAPNGRLLEKAMASLEHLVAVDLYLNETTRHAHVILPPAWSLEHDNYEAAFHLLAVRDTTKYSPAALREEPGTREDWEIISDIALRVIEGRESAPGTGLRGTLAWATARAARRLGLVPGPRFFLDLMIRFGPHGDRFRPWSDGLNLRKVAARPEGIDLGPLKTGALDRVMATKDGRIDLDHPTIARELERLAARLGEIGAGNGNGGGNGNGNGRLLLIGRRGLHTNNSWMEPTQEAVRRQGLTLHVHPRDAARIGVADGDRARVRSRVGEVTAPVKVTDDIMPGVASLPHGWSGASVNDVTDDAPLEAITGNAVLNGVPVEVEPAPVPAGAPAAS